MKSREQFRSIADVYCRTRGLLLANSTVFGYGVHGTVFSCSREYHAVRTALKIHEFEVPYFRERDVYLRLRAFEVEVVEGHYVPQLIDFDDDLLAIEMSVVVRPFVLDFGGAYLDRSPEHGEEVLAEWNREKEEQFEENWPKAQLVLSGLRRYGIYVTDVNPGNIGF
ncbi:MAG: hypothetical protein Q8M16_12675 [Pirellulaceae bacterium]|nr:hypothetical protein [Pirellulaceae bacterium]